MMIRCILNQQKQGLIKLASIEQIKYNDLCYKMHSEQVQIQNKKRYGKADNKKGTLDETNWATLH